MICRLELLYMIKKVALPLSVVGKQENTTTICLDTDYATQGYLYSELLVGRLVGRDMASLICQLLSPGDTFIDIGSHVGYYSLIAASSVGNQGKVFAFEPHPYTFRTLTLNTITNKISNWVLLNCAISNHSGTVRFDIDKKDEGTARLSYMPNDRDIEVAVTTIDEIFSLYPVGKTRLIKIDVEGFEYEALEGGKSFIRNNSVPFIIFESLTINLSSTEKIINSMQPMGYRPYIISPHINTKESLEIFNGGKLLVSLKSVSQIEAMKLQYCDILLAR